MGNKKLKVSKIPQLNPKHLNINTLASDPEGTRTLNPQNRNLILYPIELRDQEMLNVKC